MYLVESLEDVLPFPVTVPQMARQFGLVLSNLKSLSFALHAVRSKSFLKLKTESFFLELLGP